MDTDTLAEELNEGKADDLANDTGYDIEVARAYISLVGYEYATAEDLQDAYQGQFWSDEEFAENLANELGLIHDASWPNNYIDWERAAHELMFDYSEENHYYFRSV